MDIIFKDKERVKKEYFRLFLEMTTHIDKILESIDSRYQKKPSLEQLFAFSRPQSQQLHEFIGEMNQPRIRYFFGESKQLDKRDAQFNEFDHFLLDTIHFEITYQLITRLNNEYANHADEIDKGWFTPEELKATQIPPQFLIQNQLGNMRDYFFQELHFPTEGQVQIFTFNNHRLALNPQVFGGWLPKEIVPPSVPAQVDYASITLYLLLLVATGGTISALFGTTGFLVGATSAAVLGLSLSTQSVKTNGKQPPVNQDTNSDSTQVMQKLMPAGESKPAPSQDDAPVHSQLRQRVPTVEFTDETSLSVVQTI